jgi:hypothetical protein
MTGTRIGDYVLSGTLLPGPELERNKLADRWLHLEKVS